ncbi:MAG: hypothetical protein ACK5OX_01475 [Desertimonas sp.]
MSALVGVIALVAAGISVFVLTRPESSRTTDLATISTDEVVFEPVTRDDDVGVTRVWSIADDELRSTVTVTNGGDAERWVVYDEIAPDVIAPDADDVDGPSEGEVLDDGAVRFRRMLSAGDDFEVSYRAAIAKDPSLDDLEAWTEAQDEMSRSHLDDPALSPLDGDLDGVPDGADDCPDVIGDLDGCPDADDDGFAEGRDDDCPDQAGGANGCPDADGDGVLDGDDACPSAAGDPALNGCADSDADGVLDGDDRCPTTAGDAGLGGCVDGDADGVADIDDACPATAGTANGCPDSDGDSVADADDQCPDEAGAYTGCPDDFAVALLIVLSIRTHAERMGELVSFDPDGDGYVTDGQFSAYCATIQSNFQLLHDELVATDIEGLGDTSRMLFQATVNGTQTNADLAGQCALGEGIDGAWTDPNSAWLTDCELFQALRDRLLRTPVECNANF